MGIPFYVICWFSLAAFNIFSLYLIFDSLINMCLGMFLLGFILCGTLCSSWTWLTISFPTLGKFSTLMYSSVLFATFSLSSPSGSPIMWMLVCFMLSHRFLKLSSFLLILFSFQLQWFPLLCLPAYWSIPRYYLIYWSLLLVYFSFQLLYS